MLKEVIRLLLRIKPAIKYQLISVFIALTIIILSNFILINNFNFFQIELSPTLAYSPNIKQKSKKQLSKKQRTNLSRYARSLTQRGHEKLARGESEPALNMWRDAAKIYQQLGDKTGVTGSLINQSIALKELGFYRRSCKTLVSAFKSDSNICNLSNQLENSTKELDYIIQKIQKQPDKSIEIAGLKTLGDILRMIGNLEQSERVLTKTLQIAQDLNLLSSISDIRLSLGNTQQALFYREKYKYNLIVSSNNTQKKGEYADEVFQKANKAIETFKKNIFTSSPKVTVIKSKINSLRLLVDLEKFSSLDKLPSDKKQKWDKFKKYKEEIASILIENEPDFSVFSPIQEVYTRLNLVNILIQENGKNDNFNINNISEKYAKLALKKARGLNNKRAEAYALGAFGSLRFHKHQLLLSKKYIEKASIIAQSIPAPDITYKLLWQLGKIYKNLNKSDKAVIAYEAAIKNLDIVREDLLVLSPDIRFSFQENIFPIYRELMALLLKELHNNQNLEKVLEINSSLEEVKLQNFTQCNQLSLKILENLNLQNNSEKNAVGIIHIIRLKNIGKLAIIAKLPKQPNKPIYLKLYDLENFNRKINELYAILESNDFQNATLQSKSNFKKYSYNLYKLLFSDLESYLPINGTLLFTIDNFYKNIPISTLYDGNHQYLVEKYSIVMTLGGKIPQSKALSKNDLRVLFSGLITKTHDSFQDKKVIDLDLQWNALLYVENEFNYIKKNTNITKKLLDKKFTHNNFKNKLILSNFPIVHIATHGHFSSNPDKTFIAASDKLIELHEIERLIGLRNKGTYNSINLLVLSACETAKSDRIATLGMAGIATQAGAKSTLATLWKVQDDSTAKLIGEFYKALSKEKTNKAESLRQAQLSLINDRQYNHPYYWGAFVLAGNWL